MKVLARYGIVWICGIVIIALSGNSFADSKKDFFDMVKYSVVSHDQSSQFDATLNGANMYGKWMDINGDGNLDGTETLMGSVVIHREGNKSLSSGEGYNREDLKLWAQEHAAEILEIIFPAGVEELTGSSSESLMTQTVLKEKLFKKASTGYQQEQEALSNFKGVLEYQSLDVNDNSGNAYSLILGYSNEFASGFELGFTMPYRYTDMSDEVDSTSHYIGLDIYGKKSVKEWEGMALNLGGSLFGSMYYVTSDAIDHAGNLKYGASVFSSFDKDLKVGSISFGVDFRISDAHIPSSLIDTDNIFVNEIIDYVNDLDPVKTISYGINYGIPFKNNIMALNIEVIRSHYISDDIDSDRDSQTIAGIYFSYTPTQTFLLDLGVHRSFEMEDIDIFGIVLGAVYKF